jgi:hypothetical protein
MMDPDSWRQPHYDEYLAEQFAIETIEAAGIRIPVVELIKSGFYIEYLVRKDEAEGLFIDPEAGKYAGYVPNLSMRAVAKDMTRWRELEAGPRISETELQKIREIRREYQQALRR